MNDFEQVWAPGGPGTSFKATAAAGAASATTPFRVATTLGGFAVGQDGIFVTLKAQITTAGPGIHITFGPAGVAAPTAADMLLQEVDGWVRVRVPSTATDFRIFCEGTTVGSVYLYVSGKQN